MRLLLVFLFVLCLPACATVVEGTSQTVMVSTTPAGAACSVEREGVQIGALRATPEAIRVERSKNSFSVHCSRPGYQDAAATGIPHFNGMTFGNVLVGGLVGMAVDLATGANFTYPSDLRLDLQPLPGETVATAQPALRSAPASISAASAPAAGAPLALHSPTPISTPTEAGVATPVAASTGSLPGCPAPGTRAQRSDGASILYEGADPADPALCIAQVNGVRRRSRFGLWSGPEGTAGASGEEWRTVAVVTAYLDGKPRPAVRLERTRADARADFLAHSVIWVDQETGIVLRHMVNVERGVLSGGGTIPSWYVTSIATPAAMPL